MRAVATLNGDKKRLVENLKRVVLLFDHVVCLLPESAPVLHGKLNQKGIITIEKGDGRVVEEEFNFFKHTDPGYIFQPCSLHDPELEDLVAELSEKKIVSFGNPPAKYGGFDYRSLRNAVAASDMLDDRFISTSETSEDQFQLSVTRVVNRDDEGNLEEIELVNPPFAILDSYAITNVLVTAHEERGCPVFLDPWHQKLIHLRYDRVKGDGKKVAEQFPELAAPASFKSTFGSVAFELGASVFTSEALARRKPREIIRYRESMSEARTKFVSSDLVELTQLVESAPWGPKTLGEVEKYVAGRLRKDLQRYHETAQDTWEQFFGNVAVSVSKALKGGGAGGVAGGVVGNVLPNYSSWELAVIGAAAGLTAEIPELTKALVSTVLEARKRSRSSIAYIAKFESSS